MTRSSCRGGGAAVTFTTKHRVDMRVLVKTGETKFSFFSPNCNFLRSVLNAVVKDKREDQHCVQGFTETDDDDDEVIYSIVALQVECMTVCTSAHLIHDTGDAGFT